MLWSEEQLKAGVQAYVRMRQFERDGIPHNKKKKYEALSEAYGRTPKSWEYRMQNISYVYARHGYPWVKGLKPAKNVGANVLARLESLVFEYDDITPSGRVAFDSEVRQLMKTQTKKPLGQRVVKKKSETTTVFVRDAAVAAWLLNNSNGICECCGGSAPFLRDDGSPFLEIHHLRRLADGGGDTITNAAAVCPNCHRELHYGASRVLLLEQMYKAITRLIKE